LNVDFEKLVEYFTDTHVSLIRHAHLPYTLSDVRLYAVRNRVNWQRIDPASRFKITGFIFYFVLRPTLTFGRLLLRYSLIAFQYAINHSCNKRSRNHRRKLFSEQFTTRSWNEMILLVVMGPILPVTLISTLTADVPERTFAIYRRNHFAPVASGNQFRDTTQQW